MENLQRVYLEQNLQLAKTLCIKSSAAADSINDRIKLVYGDGSVNYNDLSTWKYYLNISGSYHSIDERMTVTSLDTLEEILFDRSVLAEHTATAEAYQYGTRYYYSLVDRYPDQEQLILGILYPCDIDVAIAAEDHSILAYPSYLVEEQELTLLSELEIYIKSYHERWDLPVYSLCEDLYRPAQHGQFYLSLVPKLLNLRLKRCHSNETHSFHIREYLASHGSLDKYLPYMTIKQALFLYRNLNWLNRNAGKVSTFKLLVEKLFTDRQIPLIEYSVRQLSTFDDNGYPVVRLRKKPINVQYNTPEKDYFPVSDLLIKEASTAQGNIKYLTDHLPAMERIFQNSNSSVLQTKDLESSMTDSSDAVPDPLEVVLLREWGYLASKGYYTAVVNFKDPITFEPRSLTAEDAFIYMQYLATKANGIDVKTVQDFLSCKHRRLVKPTKAELLNLVNNKYFNYSNIVDDLLLRHQHIKVSTSISAFYKTVRTIYQQCKYDWYLTSYIDDVWQRGEVENITQAFYAIDLVRFADYNMDIDTWLTERNLPLYTYTSEQALEIVKAVYITGSGVTIDETKSLKAIQDAMIAVFKQLSSYTVQIIYDTNEHKVIPLNWAALRFGNQRGVGYYEAKQFTSIEVTDVINESVLSGDIDQTDSNPLCLPMLHNAVLVEVDGASDLSSVLTEHKKLTLINQPLRIKPESKTDSLILDVLIKQDVSISFEGTGLINFDDLDTVSKLTIKSLY